MHIENTELKKELPYCSGTRMHQAKSFNDMCTPKLLTVNVEKLRNVSIIPDIIQEREYIYKLLGVTYQKRRSRHYGAILYANDTKVLYDGLKSPSIHKYDDTVMKDTQLQNCLYILLDTVL